LTDLHLNQPSILDGVTDMKRWMFLTYGVACHVLFLGLYAYMAGFVGSLLVPKTINTPAEGSLAVAVVINVLLMALFAVQHSVMARPAFKKIWTLVVPKPIERSTYVLMSCLVTAVLMWQWRGIDIVIWEASSPALRTALWVLFAAGWLLVPLVTLLINHFDLFGTRQVWLYFRGREYTSLPFRTPGVYKHVRHPLYVAWAICFWAIPTMTAGHFLFAAVLTIYMAVAALAEERDLIAHFGRQYEEYRRRIPMFIPRLRSQPAVPKGELAEKTITTHMSKERTRV
jgi:protein-S-isoprenylcysteine O-methyltransferase Ste14